MSARSAAFKTKRQQSETHSVQEMSAFSGTDPRNKEPLNIGFSIFWNWAIAMMWNSQHIYAKYMNDNKIENRIRFILCVKYSKKKTKVQPYAT